MKYLKQFFLKVDYLGYSPKLLHRQESIVKTIPGGVTTTLLAICTLLATYSFGSDIYEKKKPNIKVNSDFNKDPRLNVSNRLVVGFRLFYDGGIKMKEVNRYVDAFMLFVNKNGSIITDTRAELVNCTQTSMYKENYLNFTKFLSGLESDYFCLPDSNYTIKGKYGMPVGSHAMLRLNICKNTTENNNRCYPEEVIRKKLSTYFMTLSFINSYINNKDFHEPVHYYIDSSVLKSSAYSSRRDFLIYSNIEYNSDHGVVLSDTLTSNEFQVTSQNSEITPEPNTQIFSNLIIGLNDKKVIYDRSYVKVQEIAANVGGFVKCFLLICSFILNWLSYVNYVEEIYDNLLDFSMFINKESHGKMLATSINTVNNSHILGANIGMTKVNNFVDQSTEIVNPIIEIKPNEPCSIGGPIHLPEVILPSKSTYWHILFRCCYNKKSNCYIQKIQSDFLKKFDVSNIISVIYDNTFYHQYLLKKPERELLELHKIWSFQEMKKENSISFDDHELSEFLEVEAKKENLPKDFINFLHSK